jgi:hypothetical protein
MTRLSKKLLMLAAVAAPFLGMAQTTPATPAPPTPPATVPTPTTTPATPAPAAPVAIAPVGVKFSGYAKLDMFFDSRQIVGAREGELLLWPADQSLDIGGKDLNAVPHLNGTAAQTRLTATLSGPEIWGAKTSGVVEGEWFGVAEADYNGLRLRHANFTMAWPKTSVLFGQGWHGLFPTDCFPGHLGYTPGMPMMPLARAPQIKVTQKFNASVSGYIQLSTQRDFQTIGPAGASVAYIQNSGLPDLTAGLLYKAGKIAAGANLDYKVVRPRISDSYDAGKTNVLVEETIGAVTAQAFLKFTGPVVFKVMGMYSENQADALQIGGIAEYSNASKVKTYGVGSSTNFWAEISAPATQKVIPGIFFGYTKNNGVGAAPSGSTATAFYGRGMGSPTGGRLIDNVLQVTPRVEWKTGPVRLGVELNYSSATYGKSDATGKLVEGDAATKTFSNVRLGLNAFYSF